MDKWINRDEYLKKQKPRGISDELWKECTLYKSLMSEPTVSLSDLINRQEAIVHLQRTLDATENDDPYERGFCDGLEFAISFITGLKSAEE